MGVDAHFAQHAGEQGERVAEGEQGDVQSDVLQAIEEEDYPDQEQQVVVAGDHVLGAEVDEGQQQHPAAFLDEALVAFGHAVSQGLGRAAQQQESEQG
ncbi:hypothetical protein D9M71_306420 [compost metagenome]